MDGTELELKMEGGEEREETAPTAAPKPGVKGRG
jgi:hypothetical protein